MLYWIWEIGWEVGGYEHSTTQNNRQRPLIFFETVFDSNLSLLNYEEHFVLSLP